MWDTYSKTKYLLAFLKPFIHLNNIFKLKFFSFISANIQIFFTSTHFTTFYVHYQFLTKYMNIFVHPHYTFSSSSTSAALSLRYGLKNCFIQRFILVIALYTHNRTDLRSVCIYIMMLHYRKAWSSAVGSYIILMP